MKKNNLFLRIIGTIIGAIVGYAVTEKMFELGRHSSGEHFSLTVAADELNKKLPLMVDAETRSDKVEAGSGNVFIYDYTLPDLSKAGIDIPMIQAKMRPTIIENYKTNAQMKSLRDHGTELNYKYFDKTGEFVMEIVVSPKDF